MEELPALGLSIGDKEDTLILTKVVGTASASCLLIPTSSEQSCLYLENVLAAFDCLVGHRSGISPA